MAAYTLLLFVAIAATGIQLSVCDHKPEVTNKVQTTVEPIIKNGDATSQAPKRPVIPITDNKSSSTVKPEIRNIGNKSLPLPETVIPIIDNESPSTVKPEIKNIENKSSSTVKPEIRNIESKSLPSTESVIPIIDNESSTVKPEIKNIENESSSTVKPENRNIESKSLPSTESVIPIIDNESSTVKPEIKNIENKSSSTVKPEIRNIGIKSLPSTESVIPIIDNESSTVKPEMKNVETKAHALEREIFQNIDAKWLAIVYKKKSVFECDCSESNIANGLEQIAHGILISPNSVAIPTVKKLPKKSDLVIRVYDMKLNSTITRSTPYQQRQVFLIHRSKKNPRASHFEILGFKQPIENGVSPQHYGIKSDHCYLLYLNRISNEYVFRALKVISHFAIGNEVYDLINVITQNHVYLGAIDAVVPKNATEAVQDLPLGSPLVCYDVERSTTNVIGVNLNQQESTQWKTIYYYMRANGVFSV